MAPASEIKIFVLMGLAIVLLLRLGVPLIILKKPLIGGLLAILVDAVDFSIYSRFGWGFLTGPGFTYEYLGAQLDKYQLLDKILDTYYLALEVYTVRTWADVGARALVYRLFVWRIIGVGVFLMIPYEYIFIVFPNIFENVFLLLLVSGQHKKLEPTKLLLIMSIAVLQKLVHEFVLHSIPTGYPFTNIDKS